MAPDVPCPDGSRFAELIRAQVDEEPRLFVNQNPKPPPAYSAAKPSYQETDDNNAEAESVDPQEDVYDAEDADEEFKEKLEAQRQGLYEPYRLAHEDPPNLPAYHPSFAKVEKICEDLFTDAGKLLEASDYQDTYTQALWSKIKRHQAIAYDPPKRIGLLGDSGVGRSQILSIATKGADQN